MRIPQPRRALVIAAVAVSAIVGGAVLTPVGSASAAAAKSVLLGKSNKTSTTTTIQNTKGSALSLKAPSNKAPFQVSNSNTVKNLSADKLDGLSSSSFARQSAKTGYIIAQYPDNAICPSGTKLTGGGGGTALGTLAYTGPGYDVRVDENGDPYVVDVPNSWFAYGPEDAPSASFAECISLNGKAIPGAQSAQAAANLMHGLDAKALYKSKAPHAATLSASPSSFTSSLTTSTVKAKKYKNCKALNKVYKHGVGVKGAKDKVRGSTKPVTNFKIKKAVYNKNKNLDRDKDKIACEKR
jgi:hypothetical protein